MLKIFGIVVSCLIFMAICQFVPALPTQASTIETLQPATAVKVGDVGRYIDEYSSYIQLSTALHSSATMHLPDVHIGGQGVGGVTFFNGTIINATTDLDTEVGKPVTFGDDIRIDGAIW